MKTYIDEGKLHKIDRILEKIIDRVSGIAIAPCAVALAVWVFVFVGYIIGRQFFGMVWIFVEEYTGYWVVFLGYFGLAYALKTGVHIRSDIVTSRLPKRVRNILSIVTGLLAIPLVGYLTWRSIGWLIYGIEHNASAITSLHTPLWPAYSFIPIGLSLFTLMLLLKLVRNVIALTRGEDIESQVTIE